MILPKGFSFSGVASGIKPDRQKDLALVVSDRPATVAGVFTRNRMVAAPVVVTRRVVATGCCQAVLINSGNANAGTGRRGLGAAIQLQKRTASLLGLKADAVAVASTGKIGVSLPLTKMMRALPRLVSRLAPQGWGEASEAILTTDRFRKTVAFSGKQGSRKYSVVAFAKGAGMIRPDMGPPQATMLAFFLTDLTISRPLLCQILNRSVRETFNRITVDGDTSTNDMVLFLANGMAGTGPLSPGSREFALFSKGITRMMEVLARMMVKDGEGATKLVEVTIKGGRNELEARRTAYTIAESLLVKTSFYGEDPNWGRLLAAAGRSGATFDPARADIFYDGVAVVRRGVAASVRAERRARAVMRKSMFSVTLDLHAGPAAFRVYTSDLTVDYVRLNARYRS